MGVTQYTFSPDRQTDRQTHIMITMPIYCMQLCNQLNQSKNQMQLWNHRPIVDDPDSTVTDSAAGDLDRLCTGCLDDSDLPSIDSISVSALILRLPWLPYSCSRRCCSAKWRCFAASALCFCISASSVGATGLPMLKSTLATTEV